MLTVQIKVFPTSWEHRVPQPMLEQIIQDIAGRRAEEIEAAHSVGEYSRDSMGFVLMDPTKPLSVPSEQAIMAIIAIGQNGADFVPNAAAKAFTTRERGVDSGELVYAHQHQLGDGEFRYGFGATIDGTNGGASGATEIQDRYQAAVLCADFNLEIQQAQAAWEKDHPDGRWYCNVDQPNRRYLDVAALLTAD